MRSPRISHRSCAPKATRPAPRAVRGAADDRRSIIFSDFESPNPFWKVCRVEDIVTNEWRGVVGAGTAWAFEAGALETGDASVVLSQPTVPIHTARGVVEYSLKVGDDWIGFAAEMQRVLAVEYNEITLSKFTAGTGTNEPTGLITALLAAGGSVVVHPTTDGAYSDADLRKMGKPSPEISAAARHGWPTPPADQIRLHSALYHVSTVTLDDTIAASEIVMGRQLVENAYFTDWSVTTSGSTVVVGDFGQMLIAPSRRSDRRADPAHVRDRKQPAKGNKSSHGYDVRQQRHEPSRIHPLGQRLRIRSPAPCLCPGLGTSLCGRMSRY